MIRVITICLLAIIFLDFTFEIAKVCDTVPKQYFKLYDGLLYFSSLVYYSAEHVSRILLVTIMYFLAKRLCNYEPEFSHLVRIIFAFLIVELIDLLDFRLTGNTTWFFYSGWPVTFNILKVIIFVITLITEHFRWKHLRV
jgi:hypothetical protein